MCEVSKLVVGMVYLYYGWSGHSNSLPVLLQVGAACSHPLDLLKVRMQVQRAKAPVRARARVQATAARAPTVVSHVTVAELLRAFLTFGLTQRTGHHKDCIFID